MRALSPGEASTLEAWAETLIPADTDTGAAAAGVVGFIDIQLTRKYKRHRAAYREALTAIDRAAAARFGRGFSALEAGDRTALVAALEAGECPADLFPDGGKAAFEMVLAHTMQGFYGSPRHGGNRDYASWRMIGVPPMPVRGRQHYDITEKA